MALPKYTETRYRIWHYFYLAVCAFVFFFLIAPLFVIFPLSFNAEEFLSFSDQNYFEDFICSSNNNLNVALILSCEYMNQKGVIDKLTVFIIIFSLSLKIF